ncbi:39S ribosomal protein L10, mitochondrial [Teleopsis dalmanni]|uniref:39S ribosomal protein L10, mitochondrial n=1 Tax=Teleopsis dalmanni TaxID=139649 RepID=UPI000D32A5A2|nr:39S ribosomal protein L10, mitochondrial [Teleopsis dalmanni]
MSNFIHKAFLLTSRPPLIQFQRYRAKINIQRPRQPHYDRALVLAVTKEIVEKEPKTKNCFVKIKNTDIENPYLKIIAREVRNWFEQSRMVGIFHMNSMTEDDMFDVRVNLHKQNMVVKMYGRQIMAEALTDTKYESLLPLFNVSYRLVFSPEDRAKQLIRTVRKVPQMMLLGGIVNNVLLSRNEFMDYAQHPGLQSAQAELVQTLNMSAGNLVQQLEQHQNSFVNILDVYAKEESQIETKADSPEKK